MIIIKYDNMQPSFVAEVVQELYIGSLNPARAFPAACGGVNEHLWNNNWIEDSSSAAADEELQWYDNSFPKINQKLII